MLNTAFSSGFCARKHYKLNCITPKLTQACTIIAILQSDTPAIRVRIHDELTQKQVIISDLLSRKRPQKNQPQEVEYDYLSSNSDFEAEPKVVRKRKKQSSTGVFNSSDTYAHYGAPDLGATPSRYSKCSATGRRIHICNPIT